MSGDSKNRPIRDEDYKTLAAFRHALRNFLVFSEGAAKESGLTAQQHQALLSIKALGIDMSVTIGDLAQHLLIRHHSAVELVDRLVQGGFVSRIEGEEDRRRVVLALTKKADRLLEKLSAAHREELRRSRTLLIELLDRLDAG